VTASTPERVAASIRANAVALLPAPVLVGAVLVLLLGLPALVPVALGAAGWMLALVLRQPVALVASRTTTPQRTATIVGWCSGPAEEIVRLALVLVALRAVGDAAWAGFGWATIEVLMVVVNTLVVASLMTKDDPGSVEARELLAAQGMTTPQHPAWGFLERLSATALHLGFTLMLFVQPWLVLVTLPLHSVVNMLTVRFARTHLAGTELGLAAVGVVVLGAGVLLSAG
jgi:hypothetical protein